MHRGWGIASAVLAAVWLTVAGCSSASAGVSGFSALLSGPGTAMSGDSVVLTATFSSGVIPNSVSGDPINIIEVGPNSLVSANQSFPNGYNPPLNFTVGPLTVGTHVYQLTDVMIPIDPSLNGPFANQITIIVSAPVVAPPSAGPIDPSPIQNFLNHRGNIIASVQPLQPLSDGQFTGSIGGGGQSEPGGPTAPQEPQQFAIGPALATGDIDPGAGFTRPVSISGQIDDGIGDVTAFASLSQIAATLKARQDAKDRAGLGLGGAAPIGAPQAVSPFNAWVEVAATAYRNSAAGPTTKGSVGIAFVGMDYLIAPAVRMGWISQFDWAEESTPAVQSSAHGTGWMSGPYVAVHLSPNLTFDARAAWGRSSNQANPLGTYTDDFSTDRALVFGRLTGDYDHGAWRLSPTAEIVRFQDRQLGYINAKGVYIPEHTSSLGQVTFGPRVGYLIRPHGGGLFEPYVALKGVWTYERSADVTPSGDYVVGGQTFTGKLEAGARIWTASGIFIEGLGALDSLGDSQASAYRGQASIRVPLN